MGWTSFWRGCRILDVLGTMSIFTYIYIYRFNGCSACSSSPAWRWMSILETSQQIWKTHVTWDIVIFLEFQVGCIPCLTTLLISDCFLFGGTPNDSTPIPNLRIVWDDLGMGVSSLRVPRNSMGSDHQVSLTEKWQPLQPPWTPSSAAGALRKRLLHRPRTEPYLEDHPT